MCLYILTSPSLCSHTALHTPYTHIQNFSMSVPPFHAISIHTYYERSTLWLFVWSVIAYAFWHIFAHNSPIIFYLLGIFAFAILLISYTLLGPTCTALETHQLPWQPFFLPCPYLLLETLWIFHCSQWPSSYLRCTQTQVHQTHPC